MVAASSSRSGSWQQRTARVACHLSACVVSLHSIQRCCPSQTMSTLLDVCSAIHDVRIMSMCVLGGSRCTSDLVYLGVGYSDGSLRVT